MAEKADNEPQGEADPKAAAQASRPGTPGMPRVRWVTDSLKSSYANVCTMTSTREEVVLNFGINQEWERTGREMTIELTHRIILSPFAAQRMLESLTRLMHDYQAKHGQLSDAAAAPAKAPVEPQ